MSESNAGSVAVIPPLTPKCDACGFHHSPANTNIRVNTTNGGLRLCIQCLSDINRKNPTLVSIREILRPVLGTKMCPDCLEQGGTYPRCVTCLGTGTRDAIDGLTDVGMVERLVAMLKEKRS